MTISGSHTTVELGSMLDDLRGVSWPARHSVRGAATGTHRSRITGMSPEFTEYRPYRQGDDPRRLDWKLLARTDRAYLRITSDRATLGTTILMDASASMAYPEATSAKWAVARRIAVGLAAVAHAAGDPVGVIVPSTHGIRARPPRTRRGVVGEIAQLLAAIEPEGSVELGPTLALTHRTPRLVLISDFLGDLDGMIRATRDRIVAGAEVHAVHILAREELDPPTAPILAKDPEHPNVLRPLVDETRAEYLAIFSTWRDGLAKSWRDARASYSQVITDETASQAIRRIVRPPAQMATAR
ncbi:MAG: DUF58 domain-containing protein [Anaerolineae bacterium]|nr:DUF58 domain-containing protein [Gemmatimonadaceae bacterium]